MADTCDEKLAGMFAKKCGHRPKQGVSKKWYFNWADVDRQATQLANRGTKITLLVLKAGAKFYEAQGNEKTSSVQHALAIGDFSNGYIHTDRLNILYKGDNERERIQELVDGARVGTIVQKIDQGVNGELAFEVAGYESGMHIIEDNYNSNENSGVTQIACATKEGEEESTGLKLFLLETGYADTLEYIETNTYVPPVPDPAP